LIIADSMRASVGVSLSCSETAISEPWSDADRRSRAPRIPSEIACGISVEFGSASATMRRSFVLELADVARPAIEEEPLHGFFGDADVAFLEFLAARVTKWFHEAGDLVAAAHAGGEASAGRR